MCQAKAPPTWQCATCTFMGNLHDFLACEICGSARAPIEAHAPTNAHSPPMPHVSPSVPALVAQPVPAPEAVVPYPHPSGEDLANAALAEAKQEQMTMQHAVIGKKIRSTYGAEIGDSFDALSPAGRAEEMEASVQAWCKMAMEQNYFVKCGHQDQFRKKPFSRDGFDVSQVHEWVCDAFGLDLETLVLEYRAPTGNWFALTSNEHFMTAVQMLRPNKSSEPFSLTVRATQGSTDATAAAPEGPEPAIESAGEVEPPEYDAAHATQFLMLGLDGEDECDGPHAEQAAGEPIVWENGAQCRKCESTFGYLFTRRHHCRKCLGSFCGYCAASFYQIEADGPEVRLCDKCATTF